MAVKKKVPAKKAPAKKVAAKPRLTLKEVMATLEKAGSAQTKKTYMRHGAKEPLFGVSFALLKTLLKKIGVDHELARALWDTGNFDARNLALKIADPAQVTESELDRWARVDCARMCSWYISALASESPYGMPRARAWLASRVPGERAMGWSLVSVLAMRDEVTPDAWFLARAKEIETTIQESTNDERDLMTRALISIGCRSAALRKAAESAAKKIGPIEVDYGDTACQTPDVPGSLAKTWAHSKSKGFDSPAAHERTRESMRLRC